MRGEYYAFGTEEQEAAIKGIQTVFASGNWTFLDARIFEERDPIAGNRGFRSSTLAGGDDIFPSRAADPSKRIMAWKISNLVHRFRGLTARTWPKAVFSQASRREPVTADPKTMLAGCMHIVVLDSCSVWHSNFATCSDVCAERKNVLRTREVEKSSCLLRGR